MSDDVYTLRQILPYANVNDRDDGDLYEDNNYKDTEDHAVATETTPPPSTATRPSSM